MTYQTILAASIFLLLAFGIEQLCRRRGIPSVILLVFAGLLLKPISAWYGFDLVGINTLSRSSARSASS